MYKGQDLGPCGTEGCQNRILYSGRGPRPGMCPVHGDRRNRAKKLQRAAKNYGHAYAQAVAASGGQEAPGRPATSRRPTDHQRLAIGLALTDDPQEAAEFTGVRGYSPEELEALAVRARAAKGLVKLDAGAIGQQIRVTVALLVQDLMDKIAGTTLPAGQAGTTIRALTQAMDLLQGGPGNAYVPIQLVVKGPDGVTYDFSSRPVAGRGYEDPDEKGSVPEERASSPPVPKDST